MGRPTHTPPERDVFVARFQVMQYFLQALLRTDIRIRIRRRIIRIRIHEACIRTIIRITAEQNAATPDNPIFFHFNIPLKCFR